MLIKKMIQWFLLSIMVVIFAACSGGSGGDSAQDKAIAKTLKNLIESTNNNVEQIDNITRYMNTQEKINKSTDKVLRSLVLKLKQVTDENIRNSKK